MSTTRRLLTALVLGSIALVPGSPAVAGIPPGRYAIGDSVMLAAKEELTARGIRVNAVVSRQFRDAVPLVEQLKAAGRLRRKVIIHLGHNGILIEAADCNRISEVAGPNRTVYLVTLKIPRSYRRTQNERLAACAQRRANTLLIDWFRHSREHPSWFAADGYHLTSTGQVRYAAFVASKTG
jgi:lysophospholipase L1-like esterase